MPSPRPLHELLPWYATGRLDAGEAAEFREHLRACGACTEEMEAVREIRSEIERHGNDVFGSHPSPEELVAGVRGELAGERAVDVRRHLAVCPSCGTEADWIRGEAQAAVVAEERPSAASWRWVGLAAAAVLAAVLLLPVGRRDPGFTGIVLPQLVVPGERSASGITEVELRPGTPGVVLYLEIDLPADGFPVVLELRDESGALVHRESGLERESLISDVYANLPCSRADCPPGRYEVLVKGSGENTEDLSFGFEVVRAP